MCEHDANAHRQVWYNRQADAMAVSSRLGGMFVWSRDNRKLWVKDQEPPKEFTSCSLLVIHRYMYSSRTNPFDRNVYEIIRESNPDGSPVPSKIHLDCDISRKDLDEFVEKGRLFHETFERDLREFLVREVDPIFGDAVQTPLFCMDSSNENKFSMHYTMGGAMFCNNFHVGALMRRFRECMAEKYGEPSLGNDNPYFFKSKKKHDIVDGRVHRCVIDMIYTRNRAFRLLGNCKYSKDTLLIPYGMDRARQRDYVFTPNDLLNALVQDPVLAAKCVIFTVEDLGGVEPRSRGSSRVLVARPGAATAGSLAVRRIDLATEARRDARASSTVEQLVVPREHAQRICTELEVIHPRIQLSPFNVKYRPVQMEFIVSNMNTSMFCYIAKSCHSSAASYFVVSYTRGAYWQRCHKAGCRSRAPTLECTWDILPKLREAIDSFLSSAACSAAKPISAEKMCTLITDVEAMIPPDYVASDAPAPPSDTDVMMFLDGEHSQGY